MMTMSMLATRTCFLAAALLHRESAAYGYEPASTLVEKRELPVTGNQPFGFDISWPCSVSISPLGTSVLTTDRRGTEDKSASVSHITYVSSPQVEAAPVSAR